MSSGDKLIGELEVEDAFAVGCKRPDDACLELSGELRSRLGEKFSGRMIETAEEAPDAGVDAEVDVSSRGGIIRGVGNSN